MERGKKAKWGERSYGMTLRVGGDEMTTQKNERGRKVWRWGKTPENGRKKDTCRFCTWPRPTSGALRETTANTHLRPLRLNNGCILCTGKHTKNCKMKKNKKTKHWKELPVYIYIYIKKISYHHSNPCLRMDGSLLERWGKNYWEKEKEKNRTPGKKGSNIERLMNGEKQRLVSKGQRGWKGQRLKLKMKGHRVEQNKPVYL